MVWPKHLDDGKWKIWLLHAATPPCLGQILRLGRPWNIQFEPNVRTFNIHHNVYSVHFTTFLFTLHWYHIQFALMSAPSIHHNVYSSVHFPTSLCTLCWYHIQSALISTSLYKLYFLHFLRLLNKFKIELTLIPSTIYLVTVFGLEGTEVSSKVLQCSIRNCCVLQDIKV